MTGAPQVGMKKRQIIANSNRTMFIWIAVASAVVGICAVFGYFMVQQIAFRAKVANAAEGTANRLRDNNKAAKELVENVRVLGTSSALSSVKARPDDRPLQVILDALPADLNTLALGSSLQQKILGEANGIKVEGLTIDASSSTASGTSDELGTIPFRLTVSSPDANSLKDLLTRMERSIRTIDIDTLNLEKTDAKYTLTITAHAYFLSGKTAQLTNETVTPNEKK